MGYSNNTGLPSSTKILEAYVDKRWFKPEHSKRGEEVHNYCGAKLRHLFWPAYPQYQSYYDSFKEFSKHIKEVILVEERLRDDVLGYCGQPDLVAKLDAEYNNWIALIDWKTSVARQLYWGPQTASYKNLVESEYAIPIDRCITVRLRNEKTAGRPPLVNVFTPEETKTHWQVFCSALVTYKFFGGEYGY